MSLTKSLTSVTHFSSVAVIMSVYRGDTVELFRLAVESIKQQTYPCSLYIYRDGVVSTELQHQLNLYKSDSTITVIESQDSEGLANGLNALIDITLVGEFDYIARMDSDDISLPKRISEQVRVMESNRTIDVLGTACEEFGASYALTEKRLPIQHHALVEFSVTRCPFIHPTVMFRNTVFKRGFKYPVDTELTEDMALWFILLDHGFKFHNLDQILLKYRLNENTVQRRKGFNKAISEIKLRLRYMIKLRKLSLKNVVLILLRIVFHFLPLRLLKSAYKNLR